MKHKKQHHGSHGHHSEAEASSEAVAEQALTSESTDLDTGSEHEELKKQLEAAEKVAAEADVLYRRMAADFENYRKRTDRERQEYRGFGLQQAAEALFPALDDLDRAQAALSSQMSSEDILQSLNLIFNRIRQSTEQMGLKPIEAMGESFDPQFHEPVQKIETTEFPDGAVMEVLRKGYTLNGKVVRPALVNVAASKHDHQEEPAESTT